jgi:hypothetical protein
MKQLLFFNKVSCGSGGSYCLCPVKRYSAAVDFQQLIFWKSNVGKKLSMIVTR